MCKHLHNTRNPQVLHQMWVMIIAFVWSGPPKASIMNVFPFRKLVGGKKKTDYNEIVSVTTMTSSLCCQPTSGEAESQIWRRKETGSLTCQVQG